MAILLNIDTALDTASICLSGEKGIHGLVVNEKQKDHASWLHVAIHDLQKSEGVEQKELSAVAISIGPGSYTGLRVGLSAAKGLCYALNIPLITVGTLDIMAAAIREKNTDLICPLIDARRMEVFAAVYNKSGQQIVQPASMIVDKNSFKDLLQNHRIIFCGNGMSKLQNILCHDNAMFDDSRSTAADLSHIAYRYWQEKRFADLAYVEPFYVKEFYSKH